MAVAPGVNSLFSSLIVFSNIWVMLSCSLSPNDFGVEPEDRIASPGELINFTCVIHNYDPYVDQFHWNVSPEANNTIKVIDKYFEQTRIIWSIIILQVSIKLQYITCERIYSKHNFCISSRKATLKMQMAWHFPEENDLACGPTNPKMVQEGDTLDIFCKVAKGKPAVDITWRLVLHPSIGLPKLYLPPHEDDGLERTLTHTIQINKTLHTKEIICEVTSEIAFPGRNLTCRIGPILVYTKPTVLVDPENATLGCSQSVEFTCVAQGFPDNFSYSWSCNPKDVLMGCLSSSKTANISLIRHSNLPDIGASVKCTVSNGFKLGTGVAAVELVPSNVPYRAASETGRITKHSSEQILTIHIENYTKSGYIRERILCSIPTRIEDEVQFHWYVGDQEVHDDNPYFLIEQNSTTGSYLHLIDFKLANFNDSLSCVVRAFCNVTYVRFVKLEKSQSTITKEMQWKSSVQVGLSTTYLTQYQYSSSVPTRPISQNALQSTTELYPKENIFNVSNLPQSNNDADSHNEWKSITFALVSMGIIILVSCTVAAISAMKYRSLKGDSKNMKHLQSEDTGPIKIIDGSTSVVDHTYEDPQAMKTESTNNFGNHIFVNHEVEPNFTTNHSFLSYCTDSFSSCTSSIASMRSDSSGVYLEPNVNIHSLNLHSETDSDMHASSTCLNDPNIYENEKVFQMRMHRAEGYLGSQSNVCLSARSMKPETNPWLPMPSFPSKSLTKEHEERD